MSHFSVLVVTNDDSPASLERALLPFHEFECTGIDAHIQDIDITKEARAKYQQASRRMYRDRFGVLHDAYDDRFYRDPLPGEDVGMGMGWGGGLHWHSKDWGDGRGYRTKVHYLPDGYTEESTVVATRETFAAWAEDYYGRSPLQLDETPGESHKYGYILLNEDGEVVRIVKRTNPNAKWDWWSIGGRFSGQLIVNGWPCNHAWVRDLNMDAKRAHDRARRQAAVEEARAEVASGKSESLVQFLYGAQIFDPFYIDQELAWTFAVLKDGVWMERGEMGWWGMVSNEQAPEDWNESYRIILASLRPDQHVWVVDCHI